MRSEGVLKRKRQNLDLCNTSKLISPFWRWEGPSTQGLTRNNRRFRIGGIAHLVKIEQIRPEVLHFRKWSF